MYKICVPSRGVNDWQAFLADPVKHWKTGYSARALAYSWEQASGFPDEVLQLFISSSDPDFHEIEPILTIPEHKVSLPGGVTDSQNDAFVLARTPETLVAITIEGKVAESFGPSLGDWYKKPSTGKTTRLEYLKKQLGLTGELFPAIRYQLLHRTASAVIEARCYHAKKAAMIVHSFSPKNDWFDDFAGFVQLYGKNTEIGKLVHASTIDGIELYLGWAKGDERYLVV